MVRNKRGGNRAKKGKNSTFREQRELTKRSKDPEERQLYAIVIKRLGGKIISGVCSDGKERHIYIRGKLYKRAWMNPGDYIVVCVRPHEDDKADALHKYNDEEVMRLKKIGEIKDNDFKPEQPEDNTDTSNETTIVFEDL